MTTTTNKATCLCCGSPVTITVHYAGKWRSSDCPNFTVPPLSMAPETNAELMAEHEREGRAMSDKTGSEDRGMNTREREAKLERMLAECVPGGSSCDPQRVADAIREWFAANGTHIAEGSASGDGSRKALSATAEQPSCGQDARDAALFAFPGDAIAHVYRAKWDAERGCYVSIDPPMVTHPLQKPVGHVRKHTGEFKDMAIIVWTNEQPPEGAALYLGPPAAAAEGDEPYPYRWRKPGGLWQYVRHPNREAFAEVLRDLEECGFEVERTGSDDAAIAAQQRSST